MTDVKRTGPRPQDMATMVADAGPATTARTRGVLTVLSGPETGRVVPVSRQGVRLGRSEDCDLCFDDASLSRVHARVHQLMGAQFFLSDERSTNGTFVNGDRVLPGTGVRLADGDTVRLAGDVSAEVSLPRQEPDPAIFSREDRQDLR